MDSEMPEEMISADALLADAQTRESDYIDYRTIDGSKWRCWRVVKRTPRGVEYRFKHAPDGDEHKSHESGIINYYTWGYGKWRARWTGKNGDKFEHIPYGKGTTHSDNVLNYIGWQDPPQVEYWQVRFDLSKGLFVHQRFSPR